MKIAWIGTSVMGQSMAGHLLSAGHALTEKLYTQLKSGGGARLGTQALIKQLERMNSV